jgi:O-antigen/teichoic acid export membrane protein
MKSHSEKLGNIAWRRDERLHKFLKNAGILFSGNVGASILGLLSLSITAHALGSQGLGMLVLITTYVLVVDKLINFQSWQALIKYGAEALEQGRPEDFKSLIKFGFLLDLSTALAGAIVAASAAQYISRWLSWDADAGFMAVVYSFTIAFHIAGTPTAILRLFDRFKLFALITVIGALIKVVGVLVAFLGGAGLWAFVLIWALADISRMVLLIAISVSVLRERRYFSLRKSSTRGISTRFPGIWGFVITTNLNASIRMASREADVLIIGALLNPTSVGLYKVAKQIASILGIVTDPLYQAIYPELARLRASNDIANLMKLSVRSGLVAGCVALLMWGSIAVVAEPLLFHLFGPEFVSARAVMLWYAMAIVVAVIGFPLQPLMLAFGRPKQSLWIHVFSTWVYLSLLFPMLQRVGLNGAGMAYLGYYVTWSTLMIVVISVITTRAQENGY